MRRCCAWRICWLLLCSPAKSTNAPAVLLLRFLKKHKFDLVATRTAFLHHVRFRISSGLDTLTLNNFLSSAKCPENLFRFLPQTDSFGRPVGLLSLKEAAGLSQDDLLKFFAVVFDVGRRWLKEINEARWINEVDCGDDMDEEPAEGGSDAPVKPVVITTAPDSPVAVDEPESRQLNVNGTHFKPPLPKGTLDSDSQTTVVDDHDLLSPPRSRKRTGSNSSTSTALSLSISIPTPRRVLSDDDILRRTIVPQLSLIVDLDGVGVSNFNASLPQPLMHLMSAHFPSMLAQTYILNFRWVHQGMWGIVKNILPSGATNRITFANGVDELAGLLGIPKESISDGLCCRLTVVPFGGR